MIRVRAVGAVLMALAFTAGAAAAAEPVHRYLYMAGGGGGDRGTVAGFLDMGALVRDGDTVTVPALLVPDAPQAGPREQNFGIVVLAFNCKTRTEQGKRYAGYTATGELLGERPVDSPEQPIDTAQEDAVAAIAMACGETTPDPTARTFEDPLEAVRWSRSRLGG